MSACREYGPGELMRCPGPGRGRAVCGKAIGWVLPSSRARVCVGMTDRHGPGEARTCPGCGALLSVEFVPNLAIAMGEI